MRWRNRHSEPSSSTCPPSCQPAADDAHIRRRWHHVRADVEADPEQNQTLRHMESNRGHDGKDQDADSTLHEIFPSSLLQAEEMMLRALEESRKLCAASAADGCAQQPTDSTEVLDTIAQFHEESNGDEEKAMLQAVEASINAADLEEAQRACFEAAKVPDFRPPPRPKDESFRQMPQTVHVPEPVTDGAKGIVGAAQLRNLRRARKRAERRGDVGGASSGKAVGGCVVLVREDTRLHDNPALQCAVEEYDWVVPLYVHDDDDPSPWPVRGAGLWWRHESLACFDSSLKRLGSCITFRRGNYITEVVNVMLDVQAAALLFNRQLEPWHHQRDLELQQAVGESLGMEVRGFQGMSLCYEPWAVRDRSAPTKVMRCVPTVCAKIEAPAKRPHSLPLAALGYGRTAGRKIPPGFRQFNEMRQAIADGLAVDHDKKCKGPLDPKQDDWAYEMARFWKMGEEAAMERLEEWIKDASWGCYFPPDLNPRDSAGGRFRADRKWTGMISPYLRFGDLSPRYVYWRCKEALPHDLSRLFLKRVFLRDKAYSQLYKWPDSHSVSIRPQYEQQDWSGTATQLRRWQRGETGFPLVDAAMRQLWKVGWICNHLRHVTAQFLIEHLDLSWKDGFAWYDYTLVDTDVAINAMMWQMGGHSGIGGWNFVMHPIYAGKKVDPDGAYVRRWLPELAHLPVEYIHCPWEAPVHTKVAANVLINGIYWERVLEDLIAARLKHQRNVIKLRELFPQLVKKDGSEIIILSTGEVIHVPVRDDIRENDNDKITLMMTADDPRSSQRRKLVSKNGAHTALIYEESKRFEAMYDM